MAKPKKKKPKPKHKAKRQAPRLVESDRPFGPWTEVPDNAYEMEQIENCKIVVIHPKRRILITLTVAEARFHVSRRTLKREIYENKTLKAYRIPGAPKNSPIKVDAVEIVRRWPPRQ